MGLINNPFKVKSNHVLTVPKALSELGIILEDGRTENFKLKSTCPVEFLVKEPETLDNGDTVIDLEILKFEVEAVSKVLWPGEKVTMSGGREIGKEALPIHGQVTIPQGKKLSDGVESVQHVYIEVDTPLGKMHNVSPIPMIGKITGIPPAGVTFKTNMKTELFDGEMNTPMSAVACTSSVIN